MKIIQKIEEHIDEEISDAKKYIECAMIYKESEPAAAKVFAQLSEEEMEHSNKLHAVVTQIIQRYRDQHGEPPQDMQAVYDFLHERAIERATEVRTMQNMYNM